MGWGLAIDPKRCLSAAKSRLAAGICPFCPCQFRRFVINDSNGCCWSLAIRYWLCARSWTPEWWVSICVNEVFCLMKKISALIEGSIIVCDCTISFVGDSWVYSCWFPSSVFMGWHISFSIVVESTVTWPQALVLIIYLVGWGIWEMRINLFRLGGVTMGMMGRW